jgi:hypothetical protein
MWFFILFIVTAFALFGGFDWIQDLVSTVTAHREKMKVIEGGVSAKSLDALQKEVDVLTDIVVENEFKPDEVKEQSEQPVGK